MAVSPQPDTPQQPPKGMDPIDLPAANDLTVTLTPSRTLLPVAETGGRDFGGRPATGVQRG